MATNYPGALDVLTNPISTDATNSATVPHATQHTDLNDAVEAVQTELGTLPKGSFGSVKLRLESLAPIASPTFTGVVTIPESSVVTGLMTITPSGAAVVGLVVKGFASQSANIFEVKNSANTSLITVGSGGDLTGSELLAFGYARLGSTTSYVDEAALRVVSRSTSVVVSVIKGAASQTANLQQWQNSAGTALASVSSAGALSVASNIATNDYRDLSGFTRFDTSSATSVIKGQSSGSTVAVVKGAASQTANLQEWQNSAGTVLLNVDFSGGLNFPQATISQTNAGAIVMRVSGASGQTADLAQFRNSAGTVLASVNNVGRTGVSLGTYVTNASSLYISEANYGLSAEGGYLRFFTSPAGSGGHVFFGSADNSITRLTIANDGNTVFKGIVGQTSSLSQWRNSSDTTLISITSAGRLVISLPTATSAAAPTVASATTIAPTAAITFISGTTTIETITAPTNITSGGGTLILIPTGVFLTGITGNIAIASTSVVSKALHMTYDTTTTKWYPSY